ncbi:hypothetical protein RND81_10G243500 [Saponaria officinalis]|uniref:BHLH domain-containing protein n=1 Tax=Saponaria officinalis TaxID=3572 RepID=A0AAW1I5Z0_SAPOF
MASHLQQLLRSVCRKTEWNYAVFWKLQHRDRMVLTWEDGYYENKNKLNPSECESFNGTFGGLQDGHFAHDSLGLAVSKMSYHVHSLGEGIVGQVAATGKHQWIFAGEHATNSYSSLDLCNGWEALVAAGIKTIVVAAVPHGVIQFGSLNKVNENLQFLDHIRDAFSALQESVCEIPTPAQFSHPHTFQTSDIYSRISSPDVLQEYLLDEAANTEQNPFNSVDIQKHFRQPHTSTPYAHLNEAVGSIYIDGISNAINDANFTRNDNMQICYPSQSCITVNSTLHDGEIRGKNYGAQLKHYGGKDSSTKISEQIDLDPVDKQKVENNFDVIPEFNSSEISANFNPSFTFAAGTELHEALGPAFLRQCYAFPGEIEKRENRPNSQIPEVMETSMLTSDSCKDHLLEAVVANFCRRDALKKSNSFSTSESILTTERMARDVSVEPGKPNKKRARLGDSSRPRPRDRQLIQDRIKELRELVPNGSKCSIDSLLERTIKHMTFMQNVTKHSDKLRDCAKPKGCSETGILGSDDEQGSSWAVEVGGHMKICPILVENLNINGQMLIEMLCDDSAHFLEITDAIRGLGLTILKGVTDSHGDKTSMRFIVEGQSKRKLHRMEVLWSLIQILQ